MPRLRLNPVFYHTIHISLKKMCPNVQILTHFLLFIWNNCRIFDFNVNSPNRYVYAKTLYRIYTISARFGWTIRRFGVSCIPFLQHTAYSIQHTAYSIQHTAIRYILSLKNRKMFKEVLLLFLWWKAAPPFLIPYPGTQHT